MRVNYGIANIPIFRINIPLSGKSICFNTKMARTKPDEKIELREVLGLLYLFPGQHLSSGKVLKVFVICNNINEID